MKKIIAIILACAMVLTLGGCKDKEKTVSAEPETETSAEITGDVSGAEETVGTGAVDSTGSDVIVMTNEEGSTITITPDENGQLTFEVSIVRLGTLNDGNGVDMDGFYVFAAMTPNETEIACQISPDGNGGYKLEVVQSDWDIFPEGDVIEGFTIQ